MVIIVRERFITEREIEIRETDVERRVNRPERRPKAVGVAELDFEMPRLPAPGGEGR